MSDDVKLDYIAARNAAAARAAEETFRDMKGKLASEVHKNPAVAVTWDPTAPEGKKFQLAVMDGSAAHGGKDPAEAVCLADIPDEFMALTALVKLLNGTAGVEGDEPVKAFGAMGKAMYAEFLDRRMKAKGTYVPGNETVN